VEFEATGQTTVVVLDLPVVTDDIDPSPSISNNAPAAFPVGTTEVTWTATDASGNTSAPNTQNVTVIDTTAPVVTVTGDDPASVVLGDPYVDDGATATDLVDDDASLVITITSPSIDTSTLGPQSVDYAVTDGAGNTGYVSRTVNVVEAGALLTVAGIDPDTITRADLPAGVDVTITGTGFTASSTVTFLNGSGPTPSATEVAFVDAKNLTATISGKSGPKKSRDWDVVVTNPGGVNAACAGCLTISR
jgi:hypothetical protein